MRWVIKNDQNHYNYQNSICIYAEHGFIRCFVFIPARLPPDSRASKDVFKFVPALAVNAVLVKVRFGAVPILKVGVVAKAGNVPPIATLSEPDPKFHDRAVVHVPD